MNSVYEKEFSNMTSDLFAGRSACVLLLGPASSGKKFCLIGEEQNNIGLMGKSLDEILNRAKTEGIKVLASMWMIIEGDVRDLIENTRVK